MKDFPLIWQTYVSRCEHTLERHLSTNHPERSNTLNEAMRYACLNGGKRFRAVLVYACGSLSGVELARLDSIASAVEMVHAYSLVHDDLPAMDDDSLRRGKPTCHLQFDEATAILAGDALQSRAFEVLADANLTPFNAQQRAQMVMELAHAIGAKGMAGGQMLDMEATTKPIEQSKLVHLHELKTGALIRSSARLGCLASDSVCHSVLEKISKYAHLIGLAFQVADDILDVTSSSEALGKESERDEKMNKSTYVSLLGLEKAQEEAHKLSNQALETIQGLGDNNQFLQSLARFVITRSY